MEQNPTKKTNGGLTDRQAEALPHIAAAPTLSEGARIASIGRTTLYRWMEDDEFRRALESTRAEAADLARSELEGLMLKSTMVLADSLEDPRAHRPAQGRQRRPRPGTQGARRQGAPQAHRPRQRRTGPPSQETARLPLLQPGRRLLNMTLERAEAEEPPLP